MKKIFFFVAAISISLAGISQGKSQGKGKGNQKANPGQAKVKTNPGQGQVKTNQGQGQVKSPGNQGKAKAQGKADVQFNRNVWAGTNNSNGGNGPLPSKNQPAKVSQSFYRDYPGATNVVWSKYRGDWTATFGSGLFGTRTAVYHANGQRKDTRSIINNGQLPGGTTVWDKIFRRDNINPANEVVVVERPSIADKIFRVGTLGNTVARYLFYNAAGQQVQYDY